MCPAIVSGPCAVSRALVLVSFSHGDSLGDDGPVPLSRGGGGEGGSGKRGWGRGVKGKSSRCNKCFSLRASFARTVVGCDLHGCSHGPSSLLCVRQPPSSE